MRRNGTCGRRDAGAALTGNDAALGKDLKIYQWLNGANEFGLTLQPSLPACTTIETVGSQVGANNSITMTDNSHNLWQETCGTFGC